MTTHGIDRLRASLDHQRDGGCMEYSLDFAAMEALVRECENERDTLKYGSDYWSEACAKLTAENMELACECAGTMTANVVECPPASDGLPLRIGETVWGQDGKAWRLTAIGPTHVFGRATGSKNDKRLRPEWLTHERPDSWERVEQDAVGIDAAQEGIFRGEARTAAIVARCKKLAGVE